MDFLIFLKGIMIGVSIAAPVGPISILCIRRTLTESTYAGLATGLGAAVADGIFGILAGFGLTAISSFFVSHHVIFRLIGGIFLALLGIKIFLSKPISDCITFKSKHFFTTMIQTTILTLTNPLTILAFAGIFAGVGIGTKENDYLSASLISLGVFTGSALWFLGLSGLISLFRKKITTETLVFINKIFGLIIVCIGIFSVLSLLKI